MMNNKNRENEISNLIKNFNLTEDKKTTIPRDASNRYYIRYKNNNKKSYLLMVDDDIPNSVNQFSKISKHILSLGLHSPIIYYENFELGLMLIEDFGDNTFSKIFIELNNNNNENEIIDLYKLSINEIVKLQKNQNSTAINIPPYDGGVLLRETMLFVDWYYKFKHNGDDMNDVQKHQFKKIWLEIFASLPPYTPTLVLRDFHAGNILKSDKIGIIDFQDALIGSPSYDIASLIEDTRLPISKNTKEVLYNYYKNEMGKTNMFDDEYDIISMQRHTKVLGIFSRLGLRDGKTKYFDFIPATETIFFDKLELPIFEKLKQFFNKNFNK